MVAMIVISRSSTTPGAAVALGDPGHHLRHRPGGGNGFSGNPWWQ